MSKHLKVYISSIALFFLASTAAHALCDFEKVLISSSLNSFQNKFLGKSGVSSSKLHGYDIPIEDTSFFDSLNIYMAGQNLLTWTNYSGYDPEISSFLYNGLINGVDWNGRANARTFVVGLNVGF